VSNFFASFESYFCFQHGASLKIINTEGKTALQEAETTGQLAIERLLNEDLRKHRFEATRQRFQER
jgi:hypothetical protein